MAKGNDVRFTPSLICLCAVLTIGGCSTPRSFVRPAEFARPIAIQSNDSTFESSYARAVALEKQRDPRCLDSYLECCRQLWPLVSCESLACSPRAHDCYRSAVGRIIEVAQLCGRLETNQGIQTLTDTVPVRYVGVDWQPSEICRFATFGKYGLRAETELKTQQGIGIPIIAYHQSDRPFAQPEGASPFTALIRPEEDGSMVMDIVNPLLVRQIQIRDGDHSVPIAYDMTAHLPYYEQKHKKTWLAGFLRPERSEDSGGLTMVEPYKPGKIPLVLIHGLASDPMTWLTMASNLLMHTEVPERYQVWFYEYPTGMPFPLEAAKLRHQLVQLRNTIDPTWQDVALDNMVVIGHSMGGLMGKLQVTTSGDRLAQAVFTKPISQLKLSSEQRHEMRDTFYFEPSTQIRRVIFIGTPHRGSPIASNPVGRLASRLVYEPRDLAADFSQFTSDNVDALKDKRRIPTSVDLLRPDDELLNAIYSLPISPRVSLHSIVGIGGRRLKVGIGDGVVPLSSARHPGVESELQVDADHKLHNFPETIDEVLRILKHHADTLTTITATPPTHLKRGYKNFP